MLSSGVVHTRALVATSLTLMATSSLDRFGGRRASRGVCWVKDDAVPSYATEPDGLPCQGPFGSDGTNGGAEIIQTVLRQARERPWAGEKLLQEPRDGVSASEAATLSCSNVLERLGTTPEGLTSEEAGRRLATV